MNGEAAWSHCRTRGTCRASCRRIELDSELAQQSGIILQSQGLQASIQTGSYFEIDIPADYYYVYCWPSQTEAVEEHFLNLPHRQAKLIFCRGQSDLRCYQSRNGIGYPEDNNDPKA